MIASEYDYLRRSSAKRGTGEELTKDGVRFIWLQTGSYSKNDSGRVKSMLRYGYRAARAAVRLDPRPEHRRLVAASAGTSRRGRGRALAARPVGDGGAGLLAGGAGGPWSLAVREPYARMLQWLERRLYSSSARIVSVPPNGACRMTELGLDPGKVVHVPNGVHPEPDTRELLRL